MSRVKQQKPQPSANRTNEAFVRPTAMHMAKMNRENPTRAITNSESQQKFYENPLVAPSIVQAQLLAKPSTLKTPENDRTEPEAKGITNNALKNRPSSAHNSEIASSIQLQTQQIKNNNVQLQTSNSPATDTKIVSDLNSSKGKGSEMKTETKQEMESGFGRDFSDVKIHSDSDAIKMNEKLGAKAFTNGNDVYFNKGQYNPSTSEGKHLLAHELTHTLQQAGGSNESIQRSEVDGSAGGELMDSESEIDSFVNNILVEQKSKFDNLKDYKERVKFVNTVYSNIGKMSNLKEYQSEIEVWIEKSLEEGKYWEIPEVNETKYSGVQDEIGFWKTWKVLGPTMLVAGTRIGSDKLGHFFHEGYKNYFNEMRSYIEGDDRFTNDKKSTYPQWEVMKDQGHDLESGLQGLNTTGVYSFADLAANYSGYSFYTDLLFNPNLTFSIRSYMGEHIKADSGGNYSEGKEGYNSENTKTHWSEETNNNMYREDLARIVWSNLLKRNAWTAKGSESITSPSISFLPNLDFTSTRITINGANNLSNDEIKWTDKKAKIELIKGIPNSEKTPPKKEVYSGVKINGELEDKSDGSKKQFVLESKNENLLEITINTINKSEVWQLTKSS